MVATLKRANPKPYQKYGYLSKEQKDRIATEISDDLRKLETAYMLPLGLLSEFRGKRAVRYYKDVYLPVLKQAVAVKHYKRISVVSMAPLLGFIDNTSLTHAYQTGKGFLSTKDELFMKAYSIITESKGV